MSNYEDAVRKAAESLRKAIDAAEQNGYFVTFPSRKADLDAILISEVGPARVVTTTVVGEGVAPEVASDAAGAAQAAADKVVDKALDKDPGTGKKS